MSQRYLDTSVRRVPVQVQTRTKTVSSGRAKSTYTDVAATSMANFKPRGHSEYMVDGVLQTVLSAQAVIQYRPDLHKGDRVKCLVDNSVWDVTHVENVDMQCRDMVLTLREVEGV